MVRSPIVWSALLLFVALAARVAYVGWFGIPAQEGGDSTEYMTLATQVAHGLTFGYDGVTPSTYRPPLFSALLGAWCMLWRSTSLPTMIAFQVLVQSLCAPLTFMLALRAQASLRFALAGALLIAVDPFIVSKVVHVLQEPIQMLIATSIGCALVAWCARPSPWRAVFVGMLFGAGVLSKSPFVVGPAILLATFLWHDLRRRVPLAQAVLVCLTAMLVVLPWTARNFLVSGGRWIPVNSQNMDYTVWMVADGNFLPQESPSDAAPQAPVPLSGVLLTYGNPDGVDYLTRKNHEFLGAGLTGQDLWRAMDAASRSYLLEHPLYLLRHTVRGLLLLFSPDADRRLTPYLKTRILMMLLVHLPLAAGLVGCLVRAFRARNPAMLVLSLFVGAYLLLHAPVTDAGGRYATPVLPLLICLTGYALFGDPESDGPRPTLTRRPQCEPTT